MPNPLTHYYISELILNGLSGRAADIIKKHKKEYTLGCLGPDIIMGLVFSKDAVKRLAGENLHPQHVYAGLYNTAEYLAKNKNDEAMYAYFLGYLTHYAADSTIHPYVYYYIENRMKRKFDPILNNCLHTIVETEMDAYVGHYYLKGKKANSAYRFSMDLKRVKLVKRYFLHINKDVFKLTLNRFDIAVSAFMFKLMMFLCQRHKNGMIRFYIMEKIDRYLKAEHLLMSALRPRTLDKRYDYLNFERMPYKAVYQQDDCAMLRMTFPEMVEASRERGIHLIKTAIEHVENGIKMPLEEFEKDYNGGYNIEYAEALAKGQIITQRTCDLAAAADMENK